MKGRINEVLPRVAKPARYTGGELNEIRKPPEEVSVRIALAFPDVYEVGMSNLGLRILYYVLNSQQRISAERVFAPASDMEDEMRTHNIPLFSLESSLPLREFDLVGFSLAYEMSYTSVLNMLDLAGIPVFAGDRTDDDPIILAGGHCASNPEPMADFIDAFAIGDGEEVVLDIARELSAHRGNRRETLRALSKVDGVYVTSVHGADASTSSACSPNVRGRVVWDLERAPFPDTLIVPFTEAVHDRVAVEIMRGCGRGCRFCQAGMITRPVRERSLETLSEQACTLLDNTGYEEVALTSLSSADHSRIGELVRTLIDRHEQDKVGISLPSLRADAGCVHLAAEIQRVRKSGLTFAPEAGTQRLRDVINKNVTEKDLLDAVEAAVECGWRRIKLYFMIGLPTETDEDLQGIGGLVSRVIDMGRKHRTPLTLNITISPFVPKPHTPFQWRAMATLEELDRKISLIRPLLRGKNISLSWHDPRCSRVEAALARGDRQLGVVIHEVWKNGGKLEQDRFNNDRWLATFDTAGLDIAYYANREIPKDAPLPWDHIDVGVSKKFLALEDERANLGETTPDCRFGTCSGCGVSKALKDACGPSAVCPPAQAGRNAREEGSGAGIPPTNKSLTNDKNPQPATHNPQLPAAKVLFTFTKGEEARWLGHLDLMRVFERAIRMSGIDIIYTEGFNPRAKMSIASALPLGATADNELILIHIAKPVELKDVLSRLNRRLPKGISLTGAEILPEGVRGPTVTGGEFIVEVTLPEDESAAKLQLAIDQLLSLPEIIVRRESENKRRTIDLRPGIESIRIVDLIVDGHAWIEMKLPHLSFTVKPSEIVEALGQFVPGIRMAGIHRVRLNYRL
ncbi:MAG: TIGR03960 family B12-binding radical SAM protein [Armatimonadetes bacterium]|nr:TIGR03960 family B12-binding radical SAM protein [Armatimonadota bacterium]